MALVARDKREVDDLSRKDGFFDEMQRLLQTRRENDNLVLTADYHTHQTGFAKTERIAVSHISYLFRWTSMTIHRTVIETS